MKPDDQALDIVAANVQGFEANMAMVNEPRKRRGKAARSAKSKPQTVRAAKAKTESPKASSKAPSKAGNMPPSPVTTPGPMMSAAPAATAAHGSRMETRPTAAQMADLPKHNVLGILGFAAMPGGRAVPWNGAVVGSAAAPVIAATADGAACVKQSPVVLSVSAPGTGNFSFVPR